MRLARLANVSLLGVLLFGGGAEGEVCCGELDNGNLIFTWCPTSVLSKNVLASFNCDSALRGAEGGGFEPPRVTIFDLADKSVPLSQLDDEDPKDVKLKRGKYKSFPEKRAEILAKKDGAAGEWAFDMPLSGLYTTSMMFGVKDTQGLVDDTSEVYFETRGLAADDGGDEGELPFTRITATWHAVADGFLVSASNQDGPLGDPFQFGSEVRQLELHITRDVGELSLEVYGSGGPEGLGFFHTLETPPPPGAFVGVFGGAGLGKGAKVAAWSLSVQSIDLGLQSGIVPAAIASAAAHQLILDAVVLAENPFSVNPAAVSAKIAAGLDAMASADDELATAIEEGRLEESKQTKLVMKSSKRALKRGMKAVKLGDKLAMKENPKTGGLRKRTLRAWWAARLHLAQLFGFKSKSIDKLFQVASIEG